MTMATKTKEEEQQFSKEERFILHHCIALQESIGHSGTNHHGLEFVGG